MWKNYLSRIIRFALVTFAVCLEAGCGLSSAPAEPSIQFTKLPPFGAGTANKIEAIEGRATGVRPGQRIVLYAKSGIWWIQPFANEPFTTVQANAWWKNRTHPGSSYAALLVAADYHPRAQIEVLPEKGSAVFAVTTAEGPVAPGPKSKTLLFGGYEWEIRQISGNPGGSANDYDPANAWTDESGFLHLRITGSPGHWTSGEVNLRRSLGYGSYRFVIRNVSHLEPAAVLNLLVWSQGLLHQMDIEISRWGETATRDGQFVIQPYYVPANTMRFQAPAGTVTFMIRWAPEQASFRAFRGEVSRWETSPAAEHVFTSGVPAPGNDSVHMNLYVFANRSNPLQHGTEVIVEKFEYLP